jgi:hypothetical protein
MIEYMIVGFVGLLGLAFLIAMIYIWLKRIKFTRERFAFFSFSTCSTTLIFIVAAITSNVTPLQLIYDIFNYIQNGSPPIKKSLDPVTAIILVFLYGIFCSMAYLMFKHWKGALSRSDFISKQTHTEKGLITMAFDEFQRIISLSPALKPYIESKAVKRNNEMDSVINVSWHELAKNLLKLKRSAMEFGDWRTEHEFWLAVHKDHKKKIAIKCSIEMPTKDEIATFLEYLSKMPEPPQEVMILLKTNHKLESINVNHQKIEIITKDTLLGGLVNFSEYIEDIKIRASKDLLLGSSRTLADVYVPSRFSIGNENNDAEKLNLEESVKKWLIDPCSTQLAILGEYGQGKSSTALMITHHLLKEGVEKLDRIPILIELRGRSPKTMTTSEIISAWGGYKYNINSRELEALHLAGKLLFIFDGFDEMDLVGSPQERLSHFQSIWRFNHAQAKIIITGRPNLFLGTDERELALGLEKNSGGQAYCEAWYIKKFNIDEIRFALRASSKKVRDDVCRAIENNHNLYDVASRPSLLQAMSLLWENGDIPNDVNELTSSKVMELFISLTLRRQSEKSIKINNIEQGNLTIEAEWSKNYMVLHAAERYYFMQGIAVYMMKGKDTNQITLEELTNVTHLLAVSCPQSISNTISAQETFLTTDSIKTRIDASPEFIDRLNDDVRTCGLLVTDVVDGKFRFSHKSFLEYLVSDYAEKLYASTKDSKTSENTAISDGIATISEVTNTKFADVLNNQEIGFYFAELVIMRRSNYTLKDSPPNIEANFLLDYLVSPSWFQKIIWRFSLWLLRNDNTLALKSNARGTFYKSILLPIFSSPFIDFSKSIEYFKKPPNSAKVASIWVSISQYKGCELGHLYAALSGNKTNKYFYNLDPLNLLGERYISFLDFHKFDEDQLKKLIYTSKFNNIRYHALQLFLEQQYVKVFNEKGIDLKGIFKPTIMIRLIPMLLISCVFIFTSGLNDIAADIPVYIIFFMLLLSLPFILASFAIIYLTPIYLIRGAYPSWIPEIDHIWQDSLLQKYGNHHKYQKSIDKNIQKKVSSAQGMSVENVQNEIDTINDFLGWDLRKYLLPNLDIDPSD